MRAGWTLALCGLLHALGKHQAFQKPWLCQRQARKPNPLPQARTKTLQKVKYFAMHFSAVGKYQRGRSPGCICEKEKKRKLKKKLKRLLKKLQNSNYSLRYTTNHGSGSPSAKPNTCTAHPWHPWITWLSLTLPALLSLQENQLQKATLGWLTPSQPLITLQPVLPSPWSSPASTGQQSFARRGFGSKVQTG